MRNGSTKPIWFQTRLLEPPCYNPLTRRNHFPFIIFNFFLSYPLAHKPAAERVVVTSLINLTRSQDACFESIKKKMDISLCIHLRRLNHHRGSTQNASNVRQCKYFVDCVYKKTLFGYYMDIARPEIPLLYKYKKIIHRSAAYTIHRTKKQTRFIFIHYIVHSEFIYQHNCDTLKRSNARYGAS